MKQTTYFLACVSLILMVRTIDWAQKPELVVQAGHSEPVNSLKFSPDGKILASGSDDSTIKIWDVENEKELRTLSGHSDNVMSISFSPDGKTIASGSLDKTIKLWDVESGKGLQTLTDPFGLPIYSVLFTLDGKTLVSVSGNDRVELWDIESAKVIKTFSISSSLSDYTSSTISLDGRRLASGGNNKVTRIWDIESGRVLKTLSGQEFNADGPNSARFSQNGKLLAIYRNWLAGGKGNLPIELWDIESGQRLRTLPGHNEFIMLVSFSPNGKILASGSGDKTIKLWDVESGKELRTLPGYSNYFESLSFSPDGKTLASGSYDRTITLWDVESGKELGTLSGHSTAVGSVAFSPGGKIIASGRSDNTIKLWDIESGRALGTLSGRSSTELYSPVSARPSKRLLFSSNGKMLASYGDYDVNIELWDVERRKQLREFKGHSYYVSSVSFSPDGRILISSSAAVYGDQNREIKLWDIESGKELRTLMIPLSENEYGTTLVLFSPDGKILAFGNWDRTIKLWDVVNWKELRTLSWDLGSVVSLSFSPDGKTLASGSSNNTIKLWDVESGKELRTLFGHSSYVQSISFSPDGKTLASSSSDKTIKLWDVESGQELRTLSGHSYYVSSVSFSADGRILISGSGDTKIKFWDVTTGKDLCSLIALDEHDWVTVTPDGLFDGSPAAWNKIIWRFNNNTFNYAPVEAFFNDFYYPGLLADIFAGKRPTAPSDISQKDRRQPQLKLLLGAAQSHATLTARNVIVKIDVSQAPAGAQDVRLFRNGSLVKVWHGDVLKKRRQVTLEATIPIVAGENNLTAYAFNHDNIKSSDASLVIKGSESLMRQGNAYILAIGVNSYNNPQYNLKYAVADAQAFSTEVKRQQEMLKNYEKVEVIFLTNSAATKAKILQKLAQLASRVQPEDAVIIYFAGHGTAQQNRFYLIPYDLGYMGERTKLDLAGLQTILVHSISDRELEQFFEKIDAGQTLLVIDACNSGQALESEEKRRGPMNSKGLAQLAYEKGMYILTAAQSYQAALEAAQLGHGYLTYALVVEGLTKGEADNAPKDNTVFVREWFDYATARVPQMQLERLKKARDLGEEFSFIEGETRDVAIDKQTQFPRVFYRREIESHPLIVARAQ